MTSDGKPSKPPPNSLDDGFFTGNAPASSSAGPESMFTPDDALAPTRPAGRIVRSVAHDELGHPPEDVASEFDEDAVLGRNRGKQFVGFVLVLLGAIGGGVAGYYTLRQQAPKDAAALAASASASAKTVATPTIPSATAVPSAEMSAKPTSSADRGKTAGKNAGSTDKTGFVGSNSGAGPSGSDGPGEVKGTGELSAGEISGVVDRNRPLLKRQCWQPELAQRGGMGGSARVNASFTIGPSGAVQTASASGAEADYPGLASCIAAQVKGWKFPASASSTPVNVPFVFAAQ